MTMRWFEDLGAEERLYVVIGDATHYVSLGCPS
jgi:hypothetical protein